MGRRPVRSLRVATALVAFAASVSAAPAAHGQEIVREWFGDAAGQEFGSWIAWVGDVNADGFVDVGVGAALDSTVFNKGGMLRVISGLDGSILYTFYGDAVGAELGYLGPPIGDLDLDGYDDILVSEGNINKVMVFSGKDGSVLRTLTGTSTQMLDGSICGTGDIDGDGVPDFAVGALSKNYLTLFSGATSAVIRTLTASDPSSFYFGHGLLNPGDIDGDGVNDLIVLENACYNPAAQNCYAFSGATGALIWETSNKFNCGGRFGFGMFALSPVVIGDVNGDGIADWSMGSWYSSFYSYYGDQGIVTCYSGSDGSPILSATNPLPRESGSTFGWMIAAAGDVDSDGVPDFAASDITRVDDHGGDVFFFSGVDGAMLFHARGGSSATSFGFGLAGGIDTDGDGRLDVYAGDYLNNKNGTFAGAAAQIHVEPIVLDAFPRVDPVKNTSVTVSGGIPGNPLVIFLVDVNGTPFFNLVEISTFSPARRAINTWKLPSGLTGITARFLAFTFNASGKLQASNFETITFP